MLKNDKANRRKHSFDVFQFICIYLCGFETFPGHEPPYKASVSHTLDTPDSVGFLWTSDQPDAGTSTEQHTTLTRNKSQCHGGGIRTRNSNKRAAANPHLRTRDTGIGLACIKNYDDDDDNNNNNNNNNKNTNFFA